MEEWGLNQESRVREYRDLLCRLSDVLSAHVVLDGTGDIEEIHVLATSEKKPKAIVRDVQSALASLYGVQVDHQLVSVAQIRPEMAERMAFRLVLGGVTTQTDGRRLKAHVTLTRAGESLVGEAEGTNTVFSRRRTLALATLDAIGQCTAQAFELGGVETVSLFGQSMLVAQIYSPADDRSYTGSSVAEADADMAAVRSVLSALNRRLAILPE